MARYLTVAEWLRLSTGERYRPGDVVALAEEQAAGLIKAGCLVRAEDQVDAAASGAVEPRKPKSRKRR